MENKNNQRRGVMLYLDINVVNDLKKKGVNISALVNDFLTEYIKPQANPQDILYEAQLLEVKAEELKSKAAEEEIKIKEKKILEQEKARLAEERKAINDEIERLLFERHRLTLEMKDNFADGKDTTKLGTAQAAINAKLRELGWRPDV